MEAIPKEFFSQEAEQSVLGGLMLDGRRWVTVGQALTEESFFMSAHRVIFRAIAELASRGEPFDTVTMMDRLSKAGRLEDAGGLVYLGELARNTPSAANIDTYAAIVSERHQRRQIAAASNEGHSLARSAATPAEAIGAIRAKLDGIGNSVSTNAVDPETASKEWGDLMYERRTRNGALQGLTTGFERINKRWFGLCAPDLIIVAGRPSMGKTTFGMNVAENAAAAGAKVLVFSLEMSTKQLYDKRVSSIGGIGLKKIKDCLLDDYEWGLVTDAITKIRQRSMTINDTAAISIDAMALACAAHKSKHGLDLVLVDYLTLVACPGAESRLQEVRRISAGLKKIAKDLNVPVIALAQLNRNNEARTNKRPMMADLRESGDIEQDADIVAFVHREERYNKEDRRWEGIAEIITEKHRHGEVGVDVLTGELHYSRFANREDQSLPTNQPKGKGSRAEL